MSAQRREQQREYQRKRRADDPAYCESERERHRRYYAANREAERERNRHYREANRERRRAQRRAWAQDNPEKARANNFRNNTRRRSAEVGPDFGGELAALCEALLDDAACAYCRAAPAEHIDHIVPLSRGGRHEAGNLFGACAACNLSKRDRDVYEFWRAEHPETAPQPESPLERWVLAGHTFRPPGFGSTPVKLVGDK